MSIKGSYIIKTASQEDGLAFIRRALDEDYYDYSDQILDVYFKESFDVESDSLFLFELKMMSMAAATVFCDCLSRLTRPKPDFWCFAEHPPMQFLYKLAKGKEQVKVMFGNPRGGNFMEDGIPDEIVTEAYPRWKQGLPDDLHFGRIDKVMRQLGYL